MLARLLPALALAAVLLLAACGGESPQPTNPPAESSPDDAPAATEAAPAPAADADGLRTITIQPVGNEMLYQQTEITAEAGETVRIVLDNTPATSPAMHHNVVFLAGQDDINRVGQAAIGASGSDYIPDDPAILAATPMAGPGEIVEITFTVPEDPGDYPYICTFPGHYMMMQGVLHVTPAGA